MWGVVTAALSNLLVQAQKQGFSILLLLTACGGLWMMMMEERRAREASILELQRQIQECHAEVIQYYRDDKRRTDEIIHRNSNLLERIEQRMRQ
jgi:hypothetical protein